jgi:hypothetical protein
MVPLQNGSMADCRSARYGESNNVNDLEKIYRQFAEYFGGVGYTTQKVNVTGGIPLGNYLYPDSYIDFNYIPEVPSYGYGDMAIDFESDPIGGCNGSFFVPAQFTVDNAKVTSYSSDYWTKDLFVNSSSTGGNWANVYTLSAYGSDYTKLGDPFSIQFSPANVKSGEYNNVSLFLGTNPSQASASCSPDDRIFYTARFKVITSYSPPLPKADGNCVIVYYDKNYDGISDGTAQISIGSGAQPPCIQVQNLDMSNSIHYAFMELLKVLNFVKGGNGLPGTSGNPVNIALSDDVSIDVRSISNIPSLWGPLKFRLDVWT